MKKIIKLSGALLLAIFLLINCSDAQNKKEKQMEKPTAKPEYIISVTQGDQNFGDILIELWPEVAPKTVHNFDSLVSVKFFDGTAFHRVIAGFVIQGGDPNSKDKPKSTWGMGDKGQTTIPGEFSKDLKHQRGILSMARTPDPNSASSQFFICLGDLPSLDKQYAIFGKVLTGMEVVDKIVNSDKDGESPKVKVEMKIRKK